MMLRFIAFINFAIQGILGITLELNDRDGSYFGITSSMFLCTWLVMMQIHISSGKYKVKKGKTESLERMSALMPR